MPNLSNVVGMYANCYSISNINISNWIAPNIKSLQGFASNSGISSFDMNDCSFENLDYTTSIIDNCLNLQTINLCNWYMPKETSVRNFASNLYNLESVNLHGWNVPNLENAWYMLGGMWNNMQTLDISGWNAPKVTNLDIYCFAYGNCNIQTFNIAETKLDSITTLRSIFNRWDRVKTVNLANLYIPNVNTFGALFMFFNSLTNINLDNIYAPNVTGCNHMFDNCRSLSDESLLSITNLCSNLVNVTNVVGMFYNCRFSGATKANHLVNICLNFTNATVKIFNNQSQQSPIYNCFVNVYNIGGTDRSQELIDAGWTL